MKTRELLSCDIATFGQRIAHLKQKDLYRHMERISTALGEPDLESLLRSAIACLFADNTVPESSGEEMERVFDAIGRHIVPTQENADAVMRLLALCVTFLRARIKDAARERRLAGHAATHDPCDDPGCAEHGRAHPADERPGTAELALALSIRATIH